MERLTYFENGHWRLDFNGCQYRADFVDRLAAYEDVGLEPEQCENAKTIIQMLIADTPTVDAVSVIRCKDCGYWQDNNGGYPNEECRWREDETPDADDFCSYGKRKDGDEK